MFFYLHFFSGYINQFERLSLTSNLRFLIQNLPLNLNEWDFTRIPPILQGSG